MRGHPSAASLLGDEHPDHAVLSRGHEKLAVTCPADVQIDAGHAGPHHPVDERPSGRSRTKLTSVLAFLMPMGMFYH